MRLNDYHFVTHWRIADASVVEVADILEDTDSLARWWPSVYLEVSVLESGGTHGLGRVVDLHTKGWLPYTLRWRFTVIEERYPYGSTIEARGDFVGRGEWKFVQDGRDVAITYDWNIRAEKPLLRIFSPLLRPIFAANHRWAMRQGEICLRREVLRRRAHGAQPVTVST